MAFRIICIFTTASFPISSHRAASLSLIFSGGVIENTYYCEMPTLKAPEAIRLFSTPVVRNVARFVSGLFDYRLFRRMYWRQVGGFFRLGSHSARAYACHE
jgi:hypothetical protein